MSRRVAPPGLTDGFRCVPAENGGWVVFLTEGEYAGQRMNHEAAFSNANDMLGWLASRLCFSAPVEPARN